MNDDRQTRRGSVLGTLALLAAGFIALAITIGILVAGPEVVGMQFQKIGTGFEVVLFAVAFLIVALGLAKIVEKWRMPERPAPIVEREIVRDGTTREVRILDGRAPATSDVKVIQIPGQTVGGLPAFFPTLLQGAYNAGAAAEEQQRGRMQSLPSAQDFSEEALRRLSADDPLSDPDRDPRDWGGPIR